MNEGSAYVEIVIWSFGPTCSSPYMSIALFFPTFLVSWRVSSDNIQLKFEFCIGIRKWKMENGVEKILAWIWTSELVVNHEFSFSICYLLGETFCIMQSNKTFEQCILIRRERWSTSWWSRLFLAPMWILFTINVCLYLYIWFLVAIDKNRLWKWVWVNRRDNM